MSGIYIPGMELPKDGKVVLIDPWGNVRLYWSKDVVACGTGLHLCKASELPPHGRLIDADALHYSRVAIWHHDETVPMGGYVGGMNAVVMSAEIHNAPTIIPADPKEDTP